MNGHRLLDHTAELLRRNSILEVERETLFDALARLLSHIDLADPGPGAPNTILIGGVSIDDREFEAALRHARLVLRDEADATATAARLTESAHQGAPMRYVPHCLEVNI
jgi:hypothetical protein